MQSSLKFRVISTVILSLLIYLVIFLKMDTYHMRWWDESMFAVNTYEMLDNGKYFSLYFNGAPDLINTKPPLTVWLQLIFVKLLGYNEIAVRLPSVIASSLCVLVVFFFSLKRFGGYFAWLSALILLTSHGYTGYHTGRTADSDALLTMFALLTNINFLKFVHEKKDLSIAWFFLFLSLGFLTKMYAALLFVPAYLLVLIRHKMLKQFLVNMYFVSGLIFFVGFCFSALYLRELDTPGYFREIFFKDAGRIFRVVEDHKHSWEYYLDNFIFTRFSFWFILMLVAIFLIIKNKNEEETNIFIHLIFLIMSYLSIISLSVTKLLWYDMPLYPLMAMVTAYGLKKILENHLDTHSFNRTSLAIIVLLFSYPYWIMFRKSQENMIPTGEKRNEASERFLFLRSNGKSNLNGTKLYYYGWSGSLFFYKYKFAEKGEDLELTTEPNFQPDDKVLVSQDSLFDVLKTKYAFDLLEKENNARLIRITGSNDN